MKDVQTTTSIPKQTILVVDDELGPRESLKMILTPAYEVVLARDGQEGLALFGQHMPHLVISDIRMPRMSGVDLMKAVKKQSPETPFILLTGYGTLESAQEAVRTGAYDYISKPYNVEQIRNVIKQAIEESTKKREVHRTISVLQTMNIQLEQQIKELDQKATIGDLSAEMIHDLNNPICVLRGYIALLEDSLSRRGIYDASEEKEFLDIVKEQIERCVKLSQSFLNYARNSEQTWDRENINEVVQDTLFVLRVRMRHLNIRLETNLDRTLPPIWIQPTPMQQVFYNLTSNAIDAMEEKGGTFGIMTRLNSDESKNGGSPTVDILIRDTGTGIPAEIAEKIFTPFYTTKPKGKGTGLGLAICKRVVDEHGGKISLTSEVGEGTTFHISLPIRVERPGGEE